MKGEGAGGADGPGLSQETVYTLLSNRRRRYTIHYLQYVEQSVDLGTLSERVAAWEHGVEPPEVNSDQRKSVYTSLSQLHLPKLDEAGVVAFDQQAKTVAPTDALLDIRIYTEIVEENDFPWNRYYLGVSGLLLAVVGAAAAGLPVVGSVPEIAWGPFCCVTFLMSALAHAFVTRDMELGTAPEPPEVEHRDED